MKFLEDAGLIITDEVIDPETGEVLIEADFLTLEEAEEAGLVLTDGQGDCTPVWGSMDRV